MERPTRRLDLPAFPRSRSRPRQPVQLVLNRLHRLRRLQLLVLLLQLGSIALLLRAALQVESTPPRHRWSGVANAQSGSVPSPRIAR